MEPIERTRYATKFEGPDGRELWRSGRHIGEEIVIPSDRRPYLGEDVTYTKVKEVEVDEKMDGDEAVFDAMDE